MKFEEGKFYKTCDGHKAVVWMPDNGNGYMLGAILVSAETRWWALQQWCLDGIKTDFRNFDLVSEWTEPKKPKLLAPALYYTGTEWILGRILFESEAEAEKYHTVRDVIWPAVANKDGMYEVPQ